MIILGCDIATDTGLAWYDTTRLPDTIHTEGFHCDGADDMAKARSLREKMVPLIKWRKPDLVAFEMPHKFVKERLGKPDMLGNQKRHFGDAQTVALLNRLIGVAQCLLEGLRVPEVIEVHPKTWQTLLRGQPGEGKARATAYCQMMRVTAATNEHRRDAAVIAMWAAGHAQELRLMRHANEQQRLSLGEPATERS